MTNSPYPHISPSDRPIVVGHDGSAAADAALEWALAIAEPLGACVDIVRTWAIDGIPASASRETGVAPSFDAITAQVRHDLIADTANVLARHPHVDIGYVALLDQPAHDLIERSRTAQMLVVGSRGRGGFSSLLLGSVSAECVAHAHCPVVVVPPSALARPETPTDQAHALN